MDTTTTRLNRYLALHLGLSRREADDLISRNAVRINDELASLGARVGETDTVTVNGSPVTKKTEYTYLLFHKPVGYVCSRRRQGDSRTIYELLPEQYHDLKPVGRLDKESSGLLLLTDDGGLAHTMTHPSFHKTKTYEITISKPLEPLHRQMISDIGVTLEDGVSKLQLERLADGDETRWIVRMHEGRNRQIRRTFGGLGYNVKALHRTNFGPYVLGDLAPGTYETFSI